MPRSKECPSFTFHADEANTEVVLWIAAHYCEQNGSSATYVKELKNKSRQSAEWRTKENERKERERRAARNGKIPVVTETPPEATVTKAVEAPPPVTASTLTQPVNPKAVEPVKVKQAPEVQSDSEWITAEEVRNLIRCCTSTITNYRKQGHLNPVRMGKRSLRYDKAEVLGLLKPAKLDDESAQLVNVERKPKPMATFSANENLAR